MKRILKILLLLLFTLAAPCAFSQDNDWHKSDSIVTVDNVEYYYHVVQKGQTAYSVSKLYDIPLEDFFEYNPDAFRGIRIGEPLLIPLNFTTSYVPKQEGKNASSTGDDQLYIFHRIRKGETYYSIAQMYQIDLDALRRANQEIGATLPEGASLRIPYDQDVLSGIKIQQEHKSFDDGIYIVHAGETLTGIAKNLNTTQEALIIENPKIKKGLFSGDTLIIPKKIAAEEPKQPKNDAFHVVQKGETVYSISKQYGIQIDTLLNHNKQITGNQIKTGDTLTIPIRKNLYDFIEYRTEKRETLLDIANRFHVPLRDLKAKNPRYKNAVPKGNVVLIPIDPENIHFRFPDEQEEETIEDGLDLFAAQDTVCIGQQSREKTLHVVLMMPFATSRLNDDSFADMRRKNRASDYAFFNYLPFYQGILLALEDLENEGYHIRLNVYDITGKNSPVESILNDSKLKEADLIITLISASPFQKVADFARQHNIPLINAVSPRDNILTGYPNVVKIVPAESTIPEAVMEILPDDESVNLIVARSSKQNLPYDSLQVRAAFPLYREVVLGGDKKAIVNELVSYKKNYIVVIGSNKLEVLDLMRVLDEQRKKYDITLVGYPNWDAISEINNHYAQNLKLHFISAHFVDYKDVKTNSFLLRFRAQYNAEPNLNAFQGYDIASYFIRSAAMFGKNCILCADHVSHHFLSTQDMIFENTPGNGFSNVYWNVYTIEQLQLKKVER